jgi:V8-like Glu-specific endopeptidase
MKKYFKSLVTFIFSCWLVGIIIATSVRCDESKNCPCKGKKDDPSCICKDCKCTCCKNESEQDDEDSPLAKLRHCCVGISKFNYESDEHIRGSGTVFIYRGHHFVLTAGHVVDDLVKKIDNNPHDGKPDYKPNEPFAVKVSRYLYKNEEVYGKIENYGKIIKYSPATQSGYDLAVIYIPEPIIPFKSAVAVKSTKDYKVGDAVVHYGNMIGNVLHSSITKGHVNFKNRLLDNRYYDQVSCTAFPGSSGGGIFLEKDLSYIGMIVIGIRGADNINFAVPIRTIHEWFEKNDLKFILDPSLDCGDIKEVINPKRITPVDEASQN